MSRWPSASRTRTGRDFAFSNLRWKDPLLQALLEMNIRNMYQVREVVDGLAQFQPGPTLYRGFWAHAAMMQSEAALFLGDTAGARSSLEKFLRCQNEQGQVTVMQPYPMNRETALLVSAASRYFLLTGDSNWFRSRWPRISAGLKWIRKERKKTLDDPKAPGYGLLPAGFADGGLGGIQPEYSSTYWSLIALHEAVNVLTGMGMKREAAEWHQLFGEFSQSFRLAAARDIRRSNEGWYYLPMLVADTSTTSAVGPVRSAVPGPLHGCKGFARCGYVGHASVPRRTRPRSRCRVVA
jgi:hypothetical protein